VKIYKYEVRNIIHNTTAFFWSTKGSFAEAWSDLRSAIIKKVIMDQMCGKENCECGGRVVGKLLEMDEVIVEAKHRKGRPRTHPDDPTSNINVTLRSSTIEAAKKEKPADLSFSQHIDRLVRQGLRLS